MSKLFSVAAIAGLAQVACAQSVWSNAAGGPWGIATNWSPVGVPNGSATDVLFPLAATTNTSISPTVRNVTLSNAQAQLEIAGNSNLTVRGSVNNGGLIRVNATGGAVLTSLLLPGGSTLAGSGVLVLNANPSNLDSANINNSSAGTLTNGSSHIITGAGRVYMPMVNQGVIVADGNSRVLDFPASVVNNSLIDSLNDAVIALRGSVTQSDGALLRAESGGAIQLYNSTYSGGTVDANSGTVQPAVGAVSTLNFNSYSGVLNIVDSSGVNIVNTAYLHDGAVNINPTAGPDNTFLSFLNGGIIRGTGFTIALNANPANLDSAYVQTAGTMIIDATARILGSGRMYGTWINNGYIESSGLGRVLDIVGPITNNTQIRATSGAAIRFNSSVTQLSTATLQAAGGDMYFYTADYTNGQILSSNGGRLFIGAGTTPRFNVQNIVGDLPIPSGSSLHFVNVSPVVNGTITVNTTATNAATSVYFEQQGTLSGTSNIILNANPGNLDSAIVNNVGQLTIPPGNSIAGRGRLVGSIQNNGFVGVSGAGNVLDVVGSFVNSSLLRADAGATLTMHTGLIQNGNGQLITDGGPLYLYTQNYLGGSYAALNGGSIEVFPGTTPILTNITTTGPINIPENSALRINNANWRHDGVVTLNTAASTNISRLLFNTSGPYLGNNTIILNGNPANLDSANLVADGSVVTIPSTGSIRGVGRLSGIFINQGQISTAGPGNALDFIGGTFDNRSSVLATNGATLMLHSPWNQSPDATVTVQDSTLNLYAASYSGGRFVATGSGSIVIVAGGNLNGVQVDGTIREPANNTLTISSGNFTHNGDLILNTTATSIVTLIRFNGATTVNGTGYWRLNANAANFDSAYITATGGTMNFNKGLAGHGRVYCPMILGGSVSPDSAASPIGSIDFTAPFTLGPTSTYEVQVGPGGQRDQLTGPGIAMTLQGTLNLTYAPGYTPALNDRFNIMLTTGAGTVSGTFAQANFPTLPNPGWRWFIVYGSNSVDVVVRCMGDFNSDGNVDLFDYLDFLTQFVAGGFGADFNRDGVIDFFDYLDFVESFARGC